MRARLGINNCFAVKRWPRPGDWAAIVKNDLGLDTVELSLDLLNGPDTPACRDRLAEQTRVALVRYGLRAETVFTGLAAYSLNLFMHPDAEYRAAARRWYERVIDLTAQLGATAAGGHVGTLTVPDWSDPAASDGLADHHWPFTPERNATGLVDPGRVLDTLAGAGVTDVLLILEVIPPFEADDQQVIGDLRASADLWRAALAERALS